MDSTQIWQNTSKKCTDNWSWGSAINTIVSNSNTEKMIINSILDAGNTHSSY